MNSAQTFNQLHAFNTPHLGKKFKCIAGIITDIGMNIPANGMMPLTVRNKTTEDSIQKKLKHHV